MFAVTEHGDPLPSYTVHPLKIDEGETSWNIPSEVPVALVYNRRNYAVMMATPYDLIDFAVGFSLSERIVKSSNDILSLDIYHSDKGADLRIKISADAIDKFDVIQRRRNMVGSASCGLCGLENADTLFERLPVVSEKKIKLDEDAMSLALRNLGCHQALNKKTRSVHAAAWVNLAGDIVFIREDVGRHNAVDKLLGMLALAKHSYDDGFLLISSRCSYEIVEKAARLGVKAILSVSSPTSFALQKANEANLSIYGQSRMGVVEL